MPRFNLPSRHRKEWEDWEKKFVADRPDWEPSAIGAVLGRRTKAVKAERRRQAWAESPEGSSKG